jgi:hypothetical protein
MTRTIDAPMTRILGDLSELPLAAGVTIFESSMLGDNGAGYGRPLVAGDLFRGHSVEHCDNSSGGVGEVAVKRLRGRYRLEVTISGVARTDVGKRVYASDDETYTLTAGSNSRVGVIDRYVGTDTAVVEFQTAEPSAGPQRLSFAAAAGAENVANVTISVLDKDGRLVAGNHALAIWLSDDAGGAGLTGTTASGTVQAASGEGAVLTALTAKKHITAVTKAAGTFVLEITDSAKTGFYVAAAVLGAVGVGVSAQLVAGNYGSA